jgi:hypothetical protein
LRCPRSYRRLRWEHREWLEKKLKYSHEPALHERLADTLERCPTITSHLIGDSARKKKSFIRKVASTRNYETHLDPTNQAEAARGRRACSRSSSNSGLSLR